VAKLVVGEDHYKADVKLRTDFQAAMLSKTSVTRKGHSDYSGMNRQYISEQGIFDPGMALSEFARSGLEKRVVRETTLSILTKQTQADSHEAFIYNMLITWVKAYLYNLSGDTDGILRIKRMPYTDSHIKIPIKGDIEEHMDEYELGPPIEFDDEFEINWDLRNATNYWNRPYVLHYNGTTREQENFYLLHVLGRNINTSLHCDVGIPGLDTSLLLLDPINGRESVPGIPTISNWTQHVKFWSWIMDYVIE